MLTNFSTKKMKAIIFLAVIGILIFGFGGAEAKSYTAQEKYALAKFRPTVQDVLYLDWMKKDEYLIKFIRDRSFNLDKAKEKLRKSIAWRKANKIDEVLTDGLLEELKNDLPYRIHGRDDFGHPIITVQFGKDWNFRKLALAAKRKKALRYLYGMLEQAYKVSRDVGPNVTQSVLIVSMTNYNLREHGCLACIPFYADWTINYEANFPETLRAIIALNNPKIFETVVDLIRSLMSPGTSKAFRLFGYDRNALRNHYRKLQIDLNQLEIQYGGNLPNTNRIDPEKNKIGAQ